MPAGLEEGVGISGVDSAGVVVSDGRTYKKGEEKDYFWEIRTLGEMRQRRPGLKLRRDETDDDECFYIMFKEEPDKLPEYLPTEFRGLRVFYEIPIDGRD